MSATTLSPGPLIAVVGVCASGKSTLAQALQERGFNARQVHQEHSHVPDMWQRLTGPDVLICLDASLEVVRKRRRAPDFPDWLLADQRRRLRHARQSCDLYLQTDYMTPEEVLAAALRLLGDLSVGRASPPF